MEEFRLFIYKYPTYDEKKYFTPVIEHFFLSQEKNRGRWDSITEELSLFVNDRDIVKISIRERKEPCRIIFNYYLVIFSLASNNVSSFLLKDEKEARKNYWDKRYSYIKKNSLGSILSPDMIKKNSFKQQMDISLGEELSFLIKEIINITGEMIATKNPLSKKLYAVAKKAAEIDKKKKERRNLIRSIEI